MKKKIVLIISIGIFLLTGILYLQTKAQNSFEGNNLSKWGNYLRENFSATKKASENEEKIYAQGKNAIISVKEMEQAIYFFEMQGNSEEDAKILAYEYMKKSEALYADALLKGYSVTEEEVKKHVDELRSFMEDDILDEDSKNQIESVIAGFGDEEEYWKYEEQVYQKLLVSEKYVNDLQREFYANSFSESEEWNTYFEDLKNMLVEAEEFKIVGEL